ncbi:Cytochrome P450 monooxygenase -like protein [Cladobotryum mycophilum]|uniref:Cytochrome P450 monooxygenase -like protein n=1 Tax=Cladobotryum mycophilum TaxID=491253 RepID=A0ABR0S7W1_9HYPO
MPDFRFQNRASTLDPTAHRLLRRHLSAGYSMTNLLRLEDGLDRLTQMLKALMDQSADKQKPTHLDELFIYTSYDMAGELLFSKDFGFLELGKDVGGSIATIEMINRYIAIAGYIYWFHVMLANPFVTALGILPMGHLYDTAVNALADRQANVDARADIVSYWLKAHEKDNDSLSIRSIQGNAVLALGAGSDTVASAMQAIIYHLVTNPTAYQRIQEELDRAQSGGTACIKESLRVFTPFASSLPRVAGKDGVTIGSCTFPPGTVLSLHPWVIHHSKELWGPDAGQYNPERWFTEDIATRERYLISFSAGYSSCPGQNMARIQLSKLTATIMRDYDIRLVDENKPWHWKARVTIEIWRLALLDQDWPFTQFRRPIDRIKLDGEFQGEVISRVCFESQGVVRTSRSHIYLTGFGRINFSCHLFFFRDISFKRGLMKAVANYFNIMTLIQHIVLDPRDWIEFAYTLEFVRTSCTSLRTLVLVAPWFDTTIAMAQSGPLENLKTARNNWGQIFHRTSKEVDIQFLVSDIKHEHSTNEV